MVRKEASPGETKSVATFSSRIGWLKTCAPAIKPATCRPSWTVISTLLCRLGCARVVPANAWPASVTKKKNRLREYPRKNYRSKENRDRADAQTARHRGAFALGG